MHFYGSFSDNFRAGLNETRERESERERASEGVCADSRPTLHPVMYMSKPQIQQRVNAFYYRYSNFCSRLLCIVLMLTKNNRLNRVPEQDCLTYFVLHRTKFKPLSIGI